jgi:ribonuclease Y
MTGILLVGLLVCAVLSFFTGWILNTYFGKKSLRASKMEATSFFGNAKRESENIKKERLLEAEEENYKQKQKLEEEFRIKKIEVQKWEHDLNEKDTNIDRKADLISKKEKDIELIENELQNRENQVQSKQEKLSNLILQHNKMLEKVAGLSSEEAKSVLMNNLLDEAKRNAANHIHSIVKEAEQDAKKRAQDIILTSIQQSGMDMAIESTVAVVNLPSEDMKGRIIGREGRNIRSFETVTGVDVIVDDTPGTIILSGFDPLRREIARIVMERLVTDGRIHPGRIEDMQEKVKNEMAEHLREIGEQALLECGIHAIHPELVVSLGKLRFRTSFGQNVLQHSKEVSMIAGIIAGELGVDVSLAKRAGILHDIGRSVDRMTESNHAQVGYELSKKYNESPIVQNAIQAHHGGTDPISPISVIVLVANEISAARPGARREAIENFVKRLKQMEAIAESFEGVKSSYAIQAGKEIRVIVSPERVDDAMLTVLAEDIAKKVQDEIEYPGQIKVVVIREYRGFDYA